LKKLKTINMKEILFLLGIFIAYHLIKFIFYYRKQTKKDDEILRSITLEQALSILINELNTYAFNGNGHITHLNKTSIQIYLQNSSQIITLNLLGGIVTLVWKMKIMGREFVYSINLTNIQNVTGEEQRKSAQLIIRQFEEKLEKFKDNL